MSYCSDNCVDFHRTCHPECSIADAESKDLRTEYLHSIDDNARILRLRAYALRSE